MKDAIIMWLVIIALLTGFAIGFVAGYDTGARRQLGVICKDEQAKLLIEACNA